MRRWLLCCVVLAAGAANVIAGAASADDIGKELIENGDFSADADKDGWADGWGRSGDVRVVREGGKCWIRLFSKDGSSSAVVSQDVPLKPDWFKLKLRFRMRSKDIVQGKESWYNARLAMCFLGPDGKRVGAWPHVFEMRGTNDWTLCERVYRIPRGAVKLSFTPAIFSAPGTAEFADISLKVVSLRPKLEDARLPAGVTVRWDYENAWKRKSRTRERVCINGLWKFIPVEPEEGNIPAQGKGWGYLKVPGCWPTTETWDTGEFKPIAPEIWEEKFDFRRVEAAWYQREVTIPADWRDRRVYLDFDNVQTEAVIFIGGSEIGEIDWPGGRLDITGKVRPGGKAVLAVLVRAVPEETEKGKAAGGNTIGVRGLAGNCYVESEPPGARISDVFVQPSVKKKRLTVRVELSGLDPEGKYRIGGSVEFGGKQVKVLQGVSFRAGDLKDGSITFSEPWEDAVLWDIDQGNLHALTLALNTEEGGLCDETLPVVFGFREFGIEGRQFVLNGSRVHFFALNYSNHLPRWGRGIDGDYAGARLTFRRMREMNFNFVIFGNYDFEPGTIVTLDDTIRAADEMGFPLSFSLRHIKHCWQKFDDPKVRAKYEKLVEYCVRRYRNHPCILMWAMNHNFLGYPGDQNPSRLDGIYVPDRDDKWWRSKREVAAEAEGYVRSLDPTRPVYHHESGYCGRMITLNCYLNWTPLQERMEWLSHWHEKGRVPIFFVELGLPHVCTWGRHRGAPFIWRHKVSSEPLIVEFGAMYKGDAAYHLTAQDLEHIETVERVYGRGEPFHISSIMGKYWAEARENNFVEIQSMFTRHTWPAWRTWGVPAVLPWDQAEVARMKKRPEKEATPLETDWDSLQRPGMQPDYRRISTDYYRQPANEPYLEPSSLYHTFKRYNAPLFAYIAGRKERFTARDHNFRPGETVRKQLIVINDLRRTANVRYGWVARTGSAVVGKGDGAATVETGTVRKIPVEFTLPEDASGGCVIEAWVEDTDGRAPRVEDRFRLDILPAAERPRSSTRTAVYDPRGGTKKLLAGTGVEFDEVDAASDLSGYQLFIIGRQALGLGEPRLDLKREIERGLTVLVFEQEEDVLLKRLGFRTASPTARSVFIRQVGATENPMTIGLEERHLCSWRGEGTLLEPYPRTIGFEKHYPTAEWCGFVNTRTWKWGNYGSVASVLIEKPHTGDFMPFLDCEFDLQYSPLLEFRSARGRVIFCQLDLTGRTESDPAADRLLVNILNHAAGPPQRPPARRCLYLGGPQGKELLWRLKLKFEPVEDPGDLRPGDLLIVGEDAGPALTEAKDAIRRTVEGGAVVFSLPKTGEELKGWLPFEVKTEKQRVTHTIVDKKRIPLLAGLGNSDLHWRGRIPIEVITSRPDGSETLPTGIIQWVRRGKGQYVLCQVSPEFFKYDDFKISYLKLSALRASFMLSRVLANLGAPSDVPLLDYLERPVVTPIDLTGEWKGTADEKRTGEKLGFFKPEFDDGGWRAIRVPGRWEDQLPDLKDYDGVFWYRLKFDVPEIPSEPLTLEMNGIDDEDWTYLNGKLIGHIGQDTNPQDYWQAVRLYAIPSGLLKKQGNVLAIKVNDLRQAGGIMNAPVRIRPPSRWLESYYVNVPVATDDPYRYCRW